MTDLTRLRSLAETLNSPQSKRRDTMAGVLYEARREVAGILAEMEAEAAARAARTVATPTLRGSGKPLCQNCGDPVADALHAVGFCGTCREVGWRDISTAPRDGTRISAWHRVWKCPVSVRWLRGSAPEWVEVSLTTQWPDEAFTHWKPLPEPPALAVKTDGDRT